MARLDNNESIETKNATEDKIMAAAFWKEKEEMSACVESARRKMRFSRAADRVGHNLTAERARQMAEANMKRARKLKDFIEARRPIRK